MVLPGQRLSMAWWSRKQGLQNEGKRSVPKGLWIKCQHCGENLFEAELGDNKHVCKSCGYHIRLSTRERMDLVIDKGSFKEKDANLSPNDPLSFEIDKKKYTQSVESAIKKSNGMKDAYIAGECTINKVKVEIGFFVFEFMGGSMGSVVGEKITRQMERALKTKRPCIVFCASGGARMQEGVLSLMQMAKTSSARAKLKNADIPYIPVLLDPTTGGVAASVAMLGDITIAEPNALIGFAGPRVIEQTIRQTLPEGFQRSEFLLAHGLVDMIVPRAELKAALTRVLSWFGYSK